MGQSIAKYSIPTANWESRLIRKRSIPCSARQTEMIEYDSDVDSHETGKRIVKRQPLLFSSSTPLISRNKTYKRNCKSNDTISRHSDWPKNYCYIDSDWQSVGAKPNFQSHFVARYYKERRRLQANPKSFSPDIDEYEKQSIHSFKKKSLSLPSINRRPNSFVPISDPNQFISDTEETNETISNDPVFEYNNNYTIKRSNLSLNDPNITTPQFHKKCGNLSLNNFNSSLIDYNYITPIDKYVKKVELCKNCNFVNKTKQGNSIQRKSTSCLNCEVNQVAKNSFAKFNSQVVNFNHDHSSDFDDNDLSESFTCITDLSRKDVSISMRNNSIANYMTKENDKKQSLDKLMRSMGVIMEEDIEASVSKLTAKFKKQSNCNINLICSTGDSSEGTLEIPTLRSKPNEPNLNDQGILVTSVGSADTQQKDNQINQFDNNTDSFSNLCIAMACDNSKTDENLSTSTTLTTDKATFCHRFLVADTPENWRIFHNPKDRRVESIARISNCKIILNCDTSTVSRGMLKREVIAYAKTLTSLEKCCKLFDDKFPHFYATASLKSTRQSNRLKRWSTIGTVSDDFTS